MLKYTEDHEWLRAEGDEIVVGITPHASEQLGDVVFIELPDEGREVEAGEEVVVIESVKAASDISAPIAGVITAVNAALADEMMLHHKLLIRADRGKHAGKNRTFSISSKTKILFDGGIPFHSQIYNRAIELTKQASEVLFVSQYCPMGKLARALRERDSKLYFNHWEAASALNTLVIKAGMRSSKFETKYQHEPYLHAKFMIFTMPDGSKVALTGSHNFQNGGVILGTRELCMETTSPQIISELEVFFKNHVK